MVIDAGIGTLARDVPRRCRSSEPSGLVARVLFVTETTDDLEFNLEIRVPGDSFCDDYRIWEFGRIAYLDLLSLNGRKKGMIPVAFSWSREDLG